MRILHYNIFDGFRADRERIAAFQAWLERHSPEVLSFNEYRTADDQLCIALAEAGYCYSAVNTEAPSVNRCAVFSRLALSEQETADHFRFLRVRIGGLDLISYHASPRGVAAVLLEWEELLPRLEGRHNLVLTGDFNSLCRADRDRFFDEGAETSLGERYLLDGAPSCHFIEKLVDNGFVDLDTSEPGNAATVPTAIPRSCDGGLPMRLDYAFARLEAGKGESRVLREPPFDQLSDHYPLLITLRPEGSKG